MHYQDYYLIGTSFRFRLHIWKHNMEIEKYGWANNRISELVDIHHFHLYKNF